jgi:hypothetical protein
MVPIFEQGRGNGIGHTYDTFLRRFIEIMEEHVNANKAKAFAFILYNFHDAAAKMVLHNQGGFTRLDRLAGQELSVFYLHSDNERQIRAFNDTFLYIFDVPDKTLPFVLFFKYANGDVHDIEIAELEQSSIMFAFEELYNVLETYVDKLKPVSQKQSHKPSKFIQIYRSVKKVAAEKFIEYVLAKSTEYAGQHFL